MTVTNGASARGLLARIQRASTFLPVPLSPRSRSDGVGGRCAGGRLQETEKDRAARLEERRLAALVQLLLQFGQTASQSLRFDDATGGQSDLIGRERLRHVVDRAAPDGVDGALDRGERRDDDHPEDPAVAPASAAGVDPCVGPEPEIEEDHLEVPAIQRFERGAAGRDTEHARARRLQAEPQGLTHAGIVVDDQRGPRRLAGRRGRRRPGVRRVPSLPPVLLRKLPATRSLAEHTQKGDAETRSCGPSLQSARSTASGESCKSPATVRLDLRHLRLAR